ncbi:MAG TPA: hypothetical protein VFL41_01315 [Gaiellaceae bacterium]|nr:hypothetical protein [Gaiellaceae bacterium]
MSRDTHATPAAERTVGQLVADAIRLYQRRFFRTLALGVPPAVLALVASGRPYGQWLVLTATAGGLLLSLSYTGAVALVAEVPLDRRALLAVAVGVLVFAPVPLLLFLFVLPALAWLALVGLVVPVLMIERIPVRAALQRAVDLARADYVHALGSLATLVIVAFLSVSVLLFLIRETGEQPIRVAAFLSTAVVSPLVLVGAALLYFDQAARHHEQHGSGVPRR